MTDVEPSEKVKVYDRGIAVNNGRESLYKMLISYRTGDVLAPHLDITEAFAHGKWIISLSASALGQETAHKADREGLKVVRILEAAEVSMKEGRVHRAGVAQLLDPPRITESLVSPQTPKNRQTQ